MWHNKINTAEPAWVAQGDLGHLLFLSSKRGNSGEAVLSTCLGGVAVWGAMASFSTSAHCVGRQCAAPTLGSSRETRGVGCRCR